MKVLVSGKRRPKRITCKAHVCGAVLLYEYMDVQNAICDTPFINCPECGGIIIVGKKDSAFDTWTDEYST